MNVFSICNILNCAILFLELKLKTSTIVFSKKPQFVKSINKCLLHYFNVRYNKFYMLF